MPHDTPLVIAHRTAMGHAPENTLLGIRRALQMGCAGVEVDVRLCADGVPVLIHDERLERTANASGPIAETTLRELEEIDVGEGERIPTLRETIELVDGEMLLVLELKVSAGDDSASLCDAVLAEINRADALPWVWLWSFDSDTVIELAMRAPQGRRIAHLCLAPTPDIWQIAAQHRLDGIAMHSMGLSEANVSACRAHEMASFVWTVNEPSEIKRCVKLGATGIVGDYPERIQAVLSNP